MNNPDKLKSRELVKGLSFCVFDLETTGGNQKTDKIIEIGLVKVENLKIVEQKNFLIEPEIKIPDFIQKLTSITPENLVGKPKIEEVIDEIVVFMGDSILVAHNTSFDIPFFNSVMTRLGKKPLKNRTLCTNLMTKYLIPGLTSTNLNYMSQIFGIGHHQAHRAKDDAVATANLLLTYVDIFIGKDIQKINQLYYPRKRYELDRAHFKRKHCNDESILELIKNIKSNSWVMVLKGKNGEINFVSAEKSKEAKFEFYVTMLKSVDWVVATVRLFGDFVDALFYSHDFFLKMHSSRVEGVVEHLYSNYLPEAVRQDEVKLCIQDLSKFVIIHHLVPEQFTIIPLHNFSYKEKLIFRFPGHEKKLWRYIKTKSRKESDKKKLGKFSTLFVSFIFSYLSKSKLDNENLFLDAAFINTNIENLVGSLNAFVKDHPNPNNYPQNYI